MTYPISLTQPAKTGTRDEGLLAKLHAMRLDWSDRVRDRKTALAISEEARIKAQTSYRRMRYRHMAD